MVCRDLAVDLLGALQAAEPLGEVALNDDSPSVRQSAASWLVQLRAPPLLLPAFQASGLLPLHLFYALAASSPLTSVTLRPPSR